MSLQIIEMILRNQDLPLLEFERQFREHAKGAGFLHAEFRKLYGDFLKVERSIQKKVSSPSASRRENDGGMTDEQIVALRQYPVILRAEPPQKEPNSAVAVAAAAGKERNAKNQKPIHAEVQILSHLMDMIRRGEFKPSGSVVLYIGISKLCCLNCRAMLEVANDVFKDNQINITLQTRGRHDLDFGANWLPPKTFEVGYEAGSEGSSLEEKIGFMSKHRIDALKREKKPSGVSMVAVYSSSDDGDLHLAKISTQKELLKRQLELLQQLQRDDQNITAENVISFINIAIKLHELDRFSLILEEKNVQGFLNDLSSLARGLQEQGLSVAPKIVLKVLQNPHLVGQEMSAHFKHFSLEHSMDVAREAGIAAATGESGRFTPGADAAAAAAVPGGEPHPSKRFAIDK